MKKRIVITAAAVIAGVIIVPVMLQGKKASSENQPAVTVSPVSTVKAVRGAAVHQATVTGSIISLQDVALSSKMPGRLSGVYVREGDKVKAGDMVASLDTTELEAQVRSAQGAVAAAKARVAQAQALLGQQIVTSKSGIDSADAAYVQQKVNTTTGIASAESGLKAAQAVLSQVKEGARKQELAQADSRVALAQANFRKAESDLKRYKSLADEGAIAPATLDQFQTAYDIAKEQLNDAQQQRSIVHEGARTQEIIQAEQNVRQAEDRLRQAKAAKALDLVRSADLKSAKAAASQINVRQADLQAANAGYQQAIAGLQEAQKALSDARIVSPIGGRIAMRNAEPGQVVAAGAPLIRVVSLDSIYFDANIPERETSNLRVGQKAQIHVDALAGKTFTGIVERIYPAGSAANRTFGIRVSVTDPEHRLKPQMFAYGQIETERHTNAVLVPFDAVITANDKADAIQVFTVQDNKAHLVKMPSGLTSADGRWIEAQGIAEGTEIIISGQRSINDGDPVVSQLSTRYAYNNAPADR